MKPYTITTFCYGHKFDPVAPHWLDRIQKTCMGADVKITRTFDPSIKKEYGWWDVARLRENLHILGESKKPVIHIDLDIIIEKDIKPLVDLEYDIIIETEHNLNNAFPHECSSKLGFGVCTGFYILKPTSETFMKKIYDHMQHRTFNSMSDQVTLMNYITSHPHTITYEKTIQDNIEYTNTIIHIDDIKICVLDYNLIVRDPVFQLNQYGNHINIDNVGGVGRFLEYFKYPLHALPITCRCDKKHLGGAGNCPHIAVRAKGIFGQLCVYDNKGNLLPV